VEFASQIFAGIIILAFGLIALGYILEFLGSLFGGDTSPAEARKNLDSSIDDFVNLGETSEYRNLNVDALIVLPLKSFAEVIDCLKSDFDPLVRLAVCHMFIEQLSANYNEENNSSIGEFSFHFFKDQLSENDWSMNFEGSELGTGYFESPTFWAQSVQSLIQDRLYGECSDDEEKVNMCVHFCVEIASDIEDDELVAGFVELSQKSLSERNLLTKSAETALMSLEL
jgi:hypothetical protein